MSYALEDLTQPPTYAEARKSLYDVLTILGVNTTNWAPLGVTRTIIAVAAVMFVMVGALVAALARAGFLDTAITAWLTLVARYVYGIERLAATFAAGDLTLVNSGGGSYGPFAADEVDFRNTATGALYRNTEPFTLGALATITIAVRAVEAGTGSVAGIGEIDDIITPMAAATCSNAATFDASDEETDADLRARCRDSTGALSPNGPHDAYAHIARSAKRADGTPIGVTRVRAEPDGIGGVDVYVATASGALPVGDLAIVDEDIQTQCSPLCITPRVHNASTLTIGITYTAYCYTTTAYTEAQIKGRIALALAALAARQPIGGNVVDAGPGHFYVEDIEAAIAAATDALGVRLPLFGVHVSAPSVDVDLIRSAVPVVGVVLGAISFVNAAGLSQ